MKSTTTAFQSIFSQKLTLVPVLLKHYASLSTELEQL